MESSTYEQALRDTIDGVDVRTVRLAIARLLTEREWTQEQIADRAGIRQGHISKIVNVGDDPDELKDLAARVLFQIIERGFGLSLSAFFSQIEQPTTGEGPATVQPAPEDAGHDRASSLPSNDEMVQRFVTALARAVSEATARADEADHRLAASTRPRAAEHAPARVRHPQRTRPRKKPGRRSVK